MFWVVKQNLTAGVQRVLLKPRGIGNHKHFFVIFLTDVKESDAKCLHIFINSLLALSMNLFTKP